MEEEPVIGLFGSFTLVNTPLAVPEALNPSDILLTSPVKAGLGLPVVPETLTEWLWDGNCDVDKVILEYIYWYIEIILDIWKYIFSINTPLTNDMSLLILAGAH